MKKIIILLFIVFVTYSNAQITFPAKGADWHYMTIGGGQVGPYYYANAEIKYIKDTMVMGKNAALLGNIDNFVLSGTLNLRSKTYIYTNNDTVYFCNNTTSNQWRVLYNFNCIAGQSWTIYLQDSSLYSTNFTNTLDSVIVLVDSVKYNIINGEALKTLYVTYQNYAGNPFNTSSLIYDKIGDKNYLLNFIPREAAICDGCSAYAGLLCYQDSSFNLYQPDTSKPCNYYTLDIKQQAINNEQLNVYPNPAQNSLQVTVNTGYIVQCILYDVLGKEVRHEMLDIRQDKAQIDISNLQNGVYFLRVKAVDKTYTTKFIKD
jgi:hypothetical protein